MQTEKEEIKIPLFVGVMILYIRGPSVSSVDNSIVLSGSNYTAGTTACQSRPKSLMLNFSQ